ncbi:MAG: FAD-dependent oxidoreductase [Azoarcus sp.]|nr:FAD-dependent oxidoreductase [Azoarcus sp.]
MPNRRDFLKSTGALAAGTAAFGPAHASDVTQRALEAGKELMREFGVTDKTDRKDRKSAHVVVVGGGFGGATAAKYIRMWSDGTVKVTLVERNAQFVSCPISNLVIGGVKNIEDISAGYDNLQKQWGIEVITDSVIGIDPNTREIQLARGDTLKYDRAVLSPGVDFMPDMVEGLTGNEHLVPHAWKAGAQTVLLRSQLEAMPDGGVYALHIPLAPFRCPPGPYERASLIANYFKQHKPKSKVLILDSNPDIQSKKGLFTKAWEANYPGMIEYRANSRLMAVNAATRTAELEFSEVKADVLNVVPPMRAGRLVDFLGVDLANDRWIEVNFQTLEVKGVPGVHVLGDATLSAPGMPKSGHMANQHAKVAAAAIVEMLAGRSPNPTPVVMNTCYSFTDADTGIHVASVHQWDNEKRTLLPVDGAGGISSAGSTLEGRHALNWARNIWADMLT